MRVDEYHRYLSLQLSDVWRVRADVLPHDVRLFAGYSVELPLSVNDTQKIVHSLPEVHILRIRENVGWRERKVVRISDEIVDPWIKDRGACSYQWYF